MGHNNADQTKWLTKYYQGLVGKTIVAAAINEEGFPFFILSDGTRVEVSQDEEGNGPGFLFGLSVPK